MKLLFLAHRLPYPPDRGDRIRSWHVLRKLAQHFEVHLGCLAESREELAHLPVVEEIVASHCVPLRTRPLWRDGLQALLRRTPVSLAAFDDAELRDWAARTVREKGIGAIYVFSGQMGQFLPAGFNGRLVADLVDVDSAKFDSYAREGAGPMRWVNRREARLLRGVEADLARRADHTLLVSEEEARLLRSRLPDGVEAQVGVLRNGIDTACFDPSSVAPDPSMKDDGPHFLFAGQMDYRPNVDAVARFAQRIMPTIRAGYPAARFHIVGRSPVPQVSALEGVHGTLVHGAVPDMRPFLAGADIVTAPLSIARGVQNKVLEAMAMARPVLLTPEAATGINAQDGVHFAVASTDGEMAQKALQLLADRPRAAALGAAARYRACETMGWDAVLVRLPALVTGDAGELHRDAA